MVAWIERITDFWEAAQVELHGLYSVERVRAYIAYNQRTSTLRALLVLVLVPWPCVIVTILIDKIPLSPPAEGPDGNSFFFVRTFLAFWISTIAISLQFRHCVSSVSFSNVHMLASATFTAVPTTCVYYGLSLLIGFPLPFGILLVSPVWVTFMLIPLAPFLKQAYTQPTARTQIVNTLKSWVSQENLVLIYPTYFYVFTTLPTNAKTPFAMLLPIMKILMRNVMSRTVVHLGDEIPEIVLMNVEVFNSLFMSYCMQNSPSIWTTLGLIVIDGTQMIASMHDVNKVIKRMQIVKHRVTTERAHRIVDNPTIDQIQELRRKTILGYAQDILERQSPTLAPQNAQTAQVIVASPRMSPTSVLPLDAGLTTVKQEHKQSKSPPGSRSKLFASFSLGKVFSMPKPKSKDAPTVTKLELDYTANVRKVLYITEFVILLNYIEVIVPIIFSANLIVMYQHPNRVFYSQLSTMDDAKLRETLGNVMLYCFLQIVSLLVLFYVLWHRLRISGLHQLAFVLEKQGVQVQTKLVFWVFYNVQATLDHYGSDYSFKFAWLRSPET